MRRGPFSRATALLGVLAGAIGVVSETFRPMIGSAYTLYGLMLPVWFAMVGWRLLQFSRREPTGARGADADPDQVRA